MSTPQSKADLPVPPHEAWWALLQSRMAQVASLLPASLVGVIQFEVGRDAPSPPAFFYLQLQGPGSTGHAGVARRSDAWVECSEDLLFAQLTALASQTTPDPSPSAMEVRGHITLVRSFFEALARAPAPKSWLESRLGGTSS